MTETNLVQTETISDTAGDLNQSLSFQQFDPTQGTLYGVEITVVGDANTTASIENLGGAAATVGLSTSTVFNVAAPDGTSAESASTYAYQGANLGAYDGTTDYAGSSGTIVSGMTSTGTTTITETVDLSQFIGTGNFDLGLSTTSSSSENGDSNLQTLLTTAAGASVSVQYITTPVGSTTGGGGGDGSFLMWVSSPPISFGFTNSETTAAQAFNLADEATGWADALAVQQFDPSLGRLEGIEITLNGSAVASAAAENLGNAPISVQVRQEASIALGLPSGSLADVVFGTSDSMALGGFDGTVDYGGASGRDDQDLLASNSSGPAGTQTVSTTITDTADLAAFTGTGTYDLPITSFGTSLVNGSANLQTLLTQDAGANVEISYVYQTPAELSCFAAGTCIETDEGPVAVEHLVPGMRAVTAPLASLPQGTDPILWIGHRTVDCGRHPKPDTVWPVRIKAGAFGSGLPTRDLLLSPDHAVFWQDSLIPVRLLINGTSVVQKPADQVTYFHVELPRHSLLLAEGLAVESYLDTGNRAAFANGGRVAQIHPHFAPLIWDGYACAPLVVTGPPLEAARTRLAQHAPTAKPAQRDRRRPGHRTGIKR